MLDRSKCEKMYVWDSNDTEKHQRSRLVIEIFEDGSCIAIPKEEELGFKNKRGFSAIHWQVCEPIPQKKTRPMTNAEMRGFIANTPGIELRHVSWSVDNWRIDHGICGNAEPEQWLYRTISLTGEAGEPQKFEVEE